MNRLIRTIYRCSEQILWHHQATEITKWRFSWRRSTLNWITHSRMGSMALEEALTREHQLPIVSCLSTSEISISKKWIKITLLRTKQVYMKWQVTAQFPTSIKISRYRPI